ncbi:MAG: hypothetical protein ABS900_01880 [Candidatus Limivicinus sp.]
MIESVPGRSELDAGLREPAEKCAERNAIVRACREAGDMTLDAFLALQAEKVRHNRQIPPLRDPGDLILSASELAGRRLGQAAADGVRDALGFGVLCTADHHGGIYCAQTFQGDLFYAALLETLGYTGRYVPILGAAQVELSNSTYARGICIATDPEEKQLLPLFRRKLRNRMTSQAPPVDTGMIEEFRRGLRTVGDPNMREALDDLLRKVYESDDVLSAESFSAQTTVIGTRLSEHLFSDENTPVFTYLEAEEVVLPLLVQELREEDSLLYRLLTETEKRRALCDVRTGEGMPLAGHLFGCADGKGRKVFLLLGEDGMLSGTTLDGGELRFPADPASLIGLLESRTLFPGLYTLALLLAFERGLTWMGGMFQSLYLPEWQCLTVDLLRAAGFSEEAERICGLDGSGYLCGPMFALFRGDGFAAPAGPAEMWMLRPAWRGIRERMARTRLWDAHIIGLSEMLPDLTSREERENGWYRKITEGLYRGYLENCLS